MMIDYNVVTYHSMIRAMERTPVKNQRSAAKNVTLALLRGKPASAFSSWERNYLSSVCTSDCTALAYNNYCYVVNAEGACLTMYPLPAWFGKKKHFDGKEHIRNCKKYQRSRKDYLCDLDMAQDDSLWEPEEELEEADWEAETTFCDLERA